MVFKEDHIPKKGTYTVTYILFVYIYILYLSYYTYIAIYILHHQQAETWKAQLLFLLVSALLDSL
jgi:hypothetical protein